MRKVKNALLILLAVLLLAAGGLLPMGAAYMQDKKTANVVQYADIEALQLKMEEEQPEMSMYEKLRLMMHGIGTEITSEMTRMNGAEILESMYAQLQPFAGMGILADDLSNDYLEYYPVMVYEESSPTVYNYYWEVQMSLDASQYDHIRAILDDETGKLLAIEVTDPKNMDIPAKALAELECSISQYYFENLGITPVDAVPVDAEAVLDGYVNETLEHGDSYFLMHYQCVDVLYGEVNIEVCVDSNGFYIFPV